MSRPTGSHESIIVWTEEEKRYLRRLLSHDFLSSSDEIRRALTNRRLDGASKVAKKPVGEFRILVMGARGAGKTSLLTRICQNLQPTSDPATTTTSQTHRTTVDIDSQLYTFDALELPSQHLWRDDLIQQAIAITDAALLLYSTADPPSLRLAQGLAELVSDTIIAANREYSILLAGNKSDLPDTERRIAYSDGSKVAGGFPIKTSFMEVSAVSGDQAGLVLPKLGRDVLMLRSMREQRREYAEKVRREAEEAAKAVTTVRKRGGLWKRLSRGLFMRREVAQN